MCDKSKVSTPMSAISLAGYAWEPNDLSHYHKSNQNFVIYAPNIVTILGCQGWHPQQESNLQSPRSKRGALVH